MQLKKVRGWKPIPDDTEESTGWKGWPSKATMNWFKVKEEKQRT